LGRVKSIGKLEAKSVSSRLELGIDVKLKLIGAFLARLVSARLEDGNTDWEKDMGAALASEVGSRSACGVARAKESDAKSLDSEGKPGTAGCDTVAVAGGAGSAEVSA